MDLQKLCGALRRGSVDAHRCLGCGYEHNCSIHGCQIMRQAADQLEDLQEQVALAHAEKRAVFRLGQMDMQTSVVAALLAVADVTRGVIRSTLIEAAELVRKMEVPK